MQPERHVLLEHAIQQTQDAFLILKDEAFPKGPKVVFANPAFDLVVNFLLERGNDDESAWVMHKYDYLTNREDIIKLIYAYLRKDQRVSVETQMFRKDNTSIWLELDVDPFVIDGHDEQHWICIIRDISDKKRYLDQRPVLEKLKMRAMIQSQEKERRRISQDIHDGLGQLLTGSKLSIYHAQNLLENLQAESQALAQQFPEGLEFIKTVLTEVEQTLDDAINEARNISYNLMPKTLKEYGLVLALEQLATRMSKSGTAQIIFYHHDVDKLKLQKNVELDLFRIAQEGVNNALKYAQGTEISIQLIYNVKYVTLTIEDNGKGFDAKEMEPASSGLSNIRMRTEMLGGYATIESYPGTGTIISVEIPLKSIQST